MPREKVLVTGGAGFIGSHLVDRLIEDDNLVTVLDNLSHGSRDNLSRWEDDTRLDLVEVDLVGQEEELDSIVHGHETIVHLAANPDVRIGESNTRFDFEQNILATQNLLESIARGKTCQRLVFASTSTVYGEPGLIPTPVDYGPLRPISLYGASKLACESIISGYAQLFNFSAIILRLANVMGPRNTHGVVHDLVQKLRTNPTKLEILGDGTQRKSYFHVYDCTRAIQSLIKQGNRNDQVEVYNVGSRDAITVLEIAHTVINGLGLGGRVELHCDGGVDGGRGWKGDVKEMLLDVRKIQSAIGWTPTWNSRETVRLVAHRLSVPALKTSS